MIKLLSFDGKEFNISFEIASQSKIIYDLLVDKTFVEEEQKSISLPIQSKVLKRAIEYMEYKFKYTNSNEIIPDFDIEEEEALDLLNVSTYLGL